ncbi:hypothetical protein DI09_32p20 [Mitosporidium daphniae]|uniref:Uncharacterized protein n=1 Tax=Mitosporidium daphniae TaxID=1485682 RepID=A0A098VR62_9MICR|nr:uncharacterized protein DI09_32p20 [Mitosporidium daphniae]KGG51517.1 hypothetical protein DI09_32p20 [Mitosporidium daphniae]|eukprot:XP_013237969.1 uncharacterized protein DI09_32p20 [Mitosporidium daphniae]
MRLNLQKKKIGIIAAVSLSAMFTNVMANPCIPQKYAPYPAKSDCVQDFYNKGEPYNQLNLNPNPNPNRYPYNNGGVSGNGCNTCKQSNTDTSSFPPYSQEVEYVNNNTDNTPLCHPKLENIVSNTDKQFTKKSPIDTGIVIERYKDACESSKFEGKVDFGDKDTYNSYYPYGTGKNPRSQNNLQTGFVSACNDNSFQMKPELNKETLGIKPQDGTNNPGCLQFFNSPINTIPTNGNNNGGKVTPNYFQTPNQDSNGNFSKGTKCYNSRQGNGKTSGKQIDGSISLSDSSEICSLCAEKRYVPPPFIPTGMFTHVNETTEALIAFSSHENCYEQRPPSKFTLVCDKK